jgi:hypothetical protein
MEDIWWIEDIVESTLITTPFFSTSSVDMVGFVNPHQVVLRSTFSTLANAQNENVLKMRTKS